MKKSTVEGHRKALGIARNPEWILGLMLFLMGMSALSVACILKSNIMEFGEP